MMRFLRSQSQTVLVLILIVIGGSFLFYGNVGNLLTGSGGRGNDFGRIDGEDLSVSDLYDSVRSTRNALRLSGQGEALNQPGGPARVAEEAWSRLLFLHEADRLHIQVSDQEIVDYIRSQPVFQKDGVYSPELYQKVMANLDSSLHLTPEAFALFVRDKLRLEAVSNAFLSTVRTAPGDFSAQYEKYEGPAQVSFVTIDPKTLAASVAVKPEEIEAEYKAHPDNPDYRTAEKRKVDYVLLSLPPDQAKLPAKEKGAALEALGEKALDFALALQPDPSSTNPHPQVVPDFAAEAAKRGLKVETTDFFAVDAPPAGVPPSPTFNNAAFSLTKDNPISKVVELDSGVAVLHLNTVQPSELKPLDLVKGDITRQLQQDHAAQEAQDKAQALGQVLHDAVAKGTDFKAAAAAQKLTVQTLPSFVPSKVSQSDSRLQTIAMYSVQLAPGEVSHAVPIESDNTVLILHLDKRDPADPVGLAQFESRFRERQDDQMRNFVYLDLASWMNHRPGTRPPPDLDQYGGVE